MVNYINEIRIVDYFSVKSFSLNNIGHTLSLNLLDVLFVLLLDLFVVLLNVPFVSQLFNTGYQTSLLIRCQQIRYHVVKSIISNQFV